MKEKKNTNKAPAESRTVAQKAQAQPKRASKQVKGEKSQASARTRTQATKNKQRTGTKNAKTTNMRKGQRTPQKKEAPKRKIQPKVKIYSLGGLNEIGKNITAFECGNDIIIVDCGIGFPDDDMLGVDLVVPDFTHLQNNVDKVRGIFITHGHEDHIGSLPYFLKSMNVPVYGTRLTLGILENKLSEHKLLGSAKLHNVNAGDTVSAGCFKVEFIRVNHSIADACALAITTPQGVIVHTGDFKLDTTPIDGEMMDIVRLGQLGREGVLMLLCESTNVERAGHTPSEKNVGVSLERIFMGAQDKRIIIATFASNVHRVQQIIDASVHHGRRVAVTGRSMINVVNAAVKLGYMNVPEGVLIDIDDIKKYPPEKTTIVTTGSQGEPMSALYRMAFSDHDKVQLTDKDLVVLSSSAIPGNEKLVGKIVNEMYRRGVNVYHDSSVEVHVSGHACREELKLMHALTKPKYFMPVHGEYRHLIQHKELAESMGMSPQNIFVSDIGKVIEIDENGARFNGTVPAGKVLIDGSGIGDVGNIVLRDRKNLSESGLIIAVASVSLKEGILMSGPEIISRGFVYVRESEELINGAKEICQRAIIDALDNDINDWGELKNIMKNVLARYIFNKTKRKPVILPILMDI
ncbi:MAG: RNase J family beta-CASP ribonuclease [Clostridia bacterium]|nr:RNase J family beta-CASP ribonuclease [Clostridia bacterium]